MIICLDVRFQTLSGSSTAITNFLPSLVDANVNHEFLILQYEHQNIGVIDGLRRIYVPKTNPFFELLWIQVFLPSILSKLGCQLYVSLKHPVGPYFSSIPKIFYVHYVFGRYKGDEYPLGFKEYVYWYVLGRLSILKSTRLIAVSEFVKRSLLEGLKYPVNKIDVIPNGVSPGFTRLKNSEKEMGRERLKLPENFIFSCGNIVPVKNHETVIYAFNIVKQKFPELHLIIAGETKTSHCGKIKDEIRKLGLEKDVIFTGFIPKNDLVILYNCAQVFVFPSLTEACAIATMEAMACGLPIVASRRGAIAEICGNAGVYVDDPRDYTSLAECICRLLNENTRKKFESKALAHAENYSWKQTVIKSLLVFEKALHTT